MLQAIGTGCGCADDRFLKTSLCSALIKIPISISDVTPRARCDYCRHSTVTL